MSRLAFDPQIPLALWLPLAFAAGALLVIYAIASRGRLAGRRRWAALALMSTAVLLPLTVLLNPTWIRRLPPPAGKPRLTVLVDTSASMATQDADGETRFAAALKIAEQTREQLEDRFELEYRTFSSRSSPSDLAELKDQFDSGEFTDLASAVENALSDQPQGQAILLLSDGIHNAGGGASRVRESIARASAMATPIYTVPLGSKTEVRDLELRLNLPEEMAYVGQEVPISVTVRQRGSLTDRARLTIRQNENIIDEREVELLPDSQVEETLKVRQETVGLYRYDVEIEPIEKEVTDLNNRATLLLRVIDEPVRILLLEGKPYWDTKFLVRTLAADQSVALTSVVRVTESRFLERTVSRPESSESKPQSEETEHRTVRQEQWKTHASVRDFLGDAGELASYQVIVLGRDAEVFLTEDVLSQLRSWLSEGEGSLVCFRGAPLSQVSEHLGRLMPVRWSPARESRFRVQLTESGQSMRWLPGSEEENLLTNLPSLATVSLPERRGPLATVLATASQSPGESESPVISFQPVGNGRVVVVEGAGMWRWAFLSSRYEEYDAVYGRLWRSLVRWLVTNVGLLPSQKIALRSDKVTFGAGEIVTGSLLMRSSELGSSPPAIQLTGGGLSEPRTITPIPSSASSGLFRVVFGPLPEGQYEARVLGDEGSSAAAQSAFDVRGHVTERLDVAVRDDLMRMIADESGGALLEGGDSRELLQKFEGYLAANLPERTVRTSAWDRWWVLAGIFLLWAAAWTTRRRGGLI